MEPDFAPWPTLVHWPYPIVWAGFAWLAAGNGWRGASRLAAIVMVWWLWMTFSDLLDYGLFDDFLYGSGERQVFGHRLSFLLMANLFLLGRLAEHVPKLKDAAQSLRNTALLVGLGFFYMTTIRASFLLFDWDRSVLAATTSFATATAVLLALAALELLWLEARLANRRQWTAIPRPAAIVMAVCILASAMLVPWNFEPEFWATTAYITVNALYMAAMAGTVYGGYLAGNRVAVNLGIVFFTIWIIVLYFDTFFGLMDRSLFFVSAGLLLLGGGYVLARQRRKLLARMKRDDGNAGGVA